MLSETRRLQESLHAISTLGASLGRLRELQLQSATTKGPQFCKSEIAETSWLLQKATDDLSAALQRRPSPNTTSEPFGSQTHDSEEDVGYLQHTANRYIKDAHAIMQRERAQFEEEVAQKWREIEGNRERSRKLQQSAHLLTEQMKAFPPAQADSKLDQDHRKLAQLREELLMLEESVKNAYMQAELEQQHTAYLVTEAETQLLQTLSVMEREGVDLKEKLARIKTATRDIEKEIEKEQMLAKLVVQQREDMILSIRQNHAARVIQRAFWKYLKKKKQKKKKKKKKKDKGKKKGNLKAKANKQLDVKPVSKEPPKKPAQMTKSIRRR